MRTRPHAGQVALVAMTSLLLSTASAGAVGSGHAAHFSSSLAGSYSPDPAIARRLVTVEIKGRIGSDVLNGTVVVKLEEGATASCGATPASSPGPPLVPNDGGNGYVGGPMSYDELYSFWPPKPGSFVACTWLVDAANKVYASTQVKGVVSPFRVSLAVEVLGKGSECVSGTGGTCSGLIYGSTHPEIVVRWTTNAVALLAIDFRSASGPPCAVTRAAEPSTARSLTAQSGGPPLWEIGSTGDQTSPFTVGLGPPQVGEAILAPPILVPKGRYRVCAWIENQNTLGAGNAPAPVFTELGPASALFSYPTLTASRSATRSSAR